MQDLNRNMIKQFHNLNKAILIDILDIDKFKVN